MYLVNSKKFEAEITLDSYENNPVKNLYNDLRKAHSDRFCEYSPLMRNIAVIQNRADKALGIAIAAGTFTVIIIIALYVAGLGTPINALMVSGPTTLITITTTAVSGVLFWKRNKALNHTITKLDIQQLKDVYNPVLEAKREFASKVKSCLDSESGFISKLVDEKQA